MRCGKSLSAIVKKRKKRKTKQKTRINEKEKQLKKDKHTPASVLLSCDHREIKMKKKSHEVMNLNTNIMKWFWSFDVSITITSMHCQGNATRLIGTWIVYSFGVVVVVSCFVFFSFCGYHECCFNVCFSHNFFLLFGDLNLEVMENIMIMWTFELNLLPMRNMHGTGVISIVKNVLLSRENHGFDNGQIYYGLFVF